MPKRTFSKLFVLPRYHAVGEDGDNAEFNVELAEGGNIGFGLCIGEPSDPRLRRTGEIPYPNVPMGELFWMISPNKGLRPCAIMSEPKDVES